MNDDSEARTATTTRRRFLKGGLAAAGSLAVGAYGLGSNMLQVERATAGPWGLREPLRIGLLTDLHAPNFRFSLETLHAAVREAKLDVLAVVGDLIDRAGRESMAQQLLSGLEASVLKVATLGNWEHWGKVDLAKLKASYQAAGFALMVNDRLTLPWGGVEIPVVGLDDLIGGSPDFGLCAERPDDPALILSHCPASARAIVAQRPGASLVLAGHTHGGQIAPLGFALWTPPGSGDYVRGMYQPAERTQMCVSAGLGNSMLPFRVGSAPTLVIVEVS